MGNIVKNNIFYTERADKGAIAVYSTAAGVLTSDYNAVVDRFSTNGGTSVTSTLAQWRAFGYDTHSFVSTAAALFVDPAAKRLPAGGGLARHRHRAPTWARTWWRTSTGPRGPQRLAYDIGCYEMP